MSVISWFDCASVKLQATPTFSLEHSTRILPQLENDTLFTQLKTGSSIQQISDTLWDLTPHTMTSAIFKLDALLCLQHLQLSFGQTPLGSVRLCGSSLRRNPLQREPLDSAAKFVLSRFAYQHRVDDELVLDCPLSHVRCVINSNLLLQALYRCSSAPQGFAELLDQVQDESDKSALIELLSLLAHCGVLEIVGSEQQKYHRTDEPRAQQAQWDFHNLLFHTESIMGYDTATDKGHLFGACFPYEDRFSEQPAQHPSFTGDKITLPSANPAQFQGMSFIDLLQQRKSIRDYDTDNPITKDELGAFLDFIMCGKATAKTVYWDNKHKVTVGSRRSYPSGGALYEQEIYPVVLRCDGLENGFYHYDPFEHALTKIDTKKEAWKFNIECRFTHMPVSKRPDILFMLAARYHRTTWKYSRISYALVLKNIGCLYQTMYLVASLMGLAPCGHGGGNHKAFAELSGQDPWQEGIAGEFFLGRPATQRS